MKDHSEIPPRDRIREFIRNSGLSDEEKQAILDLDADDERLPLTIDQFRAQIAAAERRRTILADE
jgi:hypothetical protein